MPTKKKATKIKTHHARQASLDPSQSKAYPRSMLQRPRWVNLNGRWDFAIDKDALLSYPSEVQWEQKILVPFTPETPASGVGDTGFYNAVWYRRTFTAPELA